MCGIIEIIISIIYDTDRRYTSKTSIRHFNTGIRASVNILPRSYMEAIDQPIVLYILIIVQ